MSHNSPNPAHEQDDLDIDTHSNIFGNSFLPALIKAEKKESETSQRRVANIASELVTAFHEHNITKDLDSAQLHKVAKRLMNTLLEGVKDLPDFETAGKEGKAPRPEAIYGALAFWLQPQATEHSPDGTADACGAS